MSSVSLYEADINSLPEKIQQFLPVGENSTWFETYQERFPNADNRAFVLIQPTKARQLEALVEPINLIPVDHMNLDETKFLFIFDQIWTPSEPQQFINDQTARRLRIEVKDGKIENVTRHGLGIRFGSSDTSTPKPQRQPSTSLDRGMDQRREKSRVEQTKRINDLKKQVAKEEKAKVKYQDELSETKKQVQALRNQTLSANQLQADLSEARKQVQALQNQSLSANQLQADQSALAYEEELNKKELQIMDQEREIQELEQTIHAMNLSNPSTNTEPPIVATTGLVTQKKSNVNVGKINVPIYDEATGDIYETLEQLNTVLNLAGNSKDVTKTIIYSFLQKNHWESMLNSNPKILEDFEILRDELVERHDPQRDSTQKYIEISQRSGEDEKDYFGRLERGYRIFMKIKPNASLTDQQKEAIKTRFVTTLLRKEVRVYMKGVIDGVKYEEIAEKARKYRRVVETEEESNVLAATQLPSQSQTIKTESTEETKTCKFCRLPHDSSECHASDKFRRKSNRQFYPPSRQAFTIPPRKLGNNVRFNDQFPPAEPGEDDRTGRPRYRRPFVRRSQIPARNFSRESQRYNTNDRSRSRDFKRNFDRSRSRENGIRNNGYRRDNYGRGRYNRPWTARRGDSNYRRNSSWNRDDGRQKDKFRSHLVNLSQTMDEDHSTSILKAPVEVNEVQQFIY